MRCALCGKPLLNPTVMIGREAIGPKCARKAGLTKVAKKTGSRVLFFGRVRNESRDPQTGDLFDVLNGSESEPDGAE